MYDQNLQKMLNTLDTSKIKTPRKRYLYAPFIGFLVLGAVIAGSVYYSNTFPKVTEEDLARLIVVASKTSDNDPIRILGDVERHMGKDVKDFSQQERAGAINYLMNHIELHHKNQSLISY